MVDAPERLVVDDDVGRAEDAAGKRGVDLAAQPLLDRRIARAASTAVLSWPRPAAISATVPAPDMSRPAAKAALKSASARVLAAASSRSASQ